MEGQRQLLLQRGVGDAHRGEDDGPAELPLLLRGRVKLQAAVALLQVLEVHQLLVVHKITVRADLQVVRDGDGPRQTVVQLEAGQLLGAELFGWRGAGD